MATERLLMRHIREILRLKWTTSQPLLTLANSREQGWQATLALR